ncbi:hypothetical protein ACH5RR_026187 [Cinchona calisaya]|uniref:Uncharacterized protein n=1 Tax=Cinchona calisaya TaxID=153742 RepID=A0ABD2Z1U2_9GENT
MGYSEDSCEVKNPPDNPKGSNSQVFKGGDAPILNSNLASNQKQQLVPKMSQLTKVGDDVTMGSLGLTASNKAIVPTYISPSSMVISANPNKGVEEAIILGEVQVAAVSPLVAVANYKNHVGDVNPISNGTVEIDRTHFNQSHVNLHAS